MKTMIRSLVTVTLLSLSALAFANTPKKTENKALHVTGTLVSEDSSKNQVTIMVKQKGKFEDLVFNVPAGTNVELGSKAASLGDLKKGETINLSYAREGAARNATKITADPLPIKKTTTKKQSPKK
jgi:hypothetical protein